MIQPPVSNTVCSSLNGAVLRTIISVVLIFTLSACSTWAQHGITVTKNQSLRLGVLPVSVTAEIDKASDISSLPAAPDNGEGFIENQMKETAGDLTTILKSRLNESGNIEVVDIDWDEVSQSGNFTSTSPSAWSSDDLRTLKEERNVQAVLVVVLAGYGKLKKKWLTFLIGTGIIEGVVQGVVAARLVDNTWVGVAVAAEEIGQEVLVWGGGSYLFNKHYAPVTLEAQLLSTADGMKIWDDTVFVSIDKDAIDLLPEAEQKKKEVQLKLTANKAISELIENINKALLRNLNYGNKSRTEHTATLHP